MKRKNPWRCATCALLWWLWKEKNSRMFEDKSMSFDSFWLLFKLQPFGGVQITPISFVIITYL